MVWGSVRADAREEGGEGLPGRKRRRLGALVAAHACGSEVEQGWGWLGWALLGLQTAGSELTIFFPLSFIYFCFSIFIFRKR
jgi:hypothetical protein